jgi:hypothetical protein
MKLLLHTKLQSCTTGAATCLVFGLLGLVLLQILLALLCCCKTATCADLMAGFHLHKAVKGVGGRREGAYLCISLGKLQVLGL